MSYHKDQLITDGLPPLFDDKLKKLRQDIISGQLTNSAADPFTEFKTVGSTFFTSSRRNFLPGIDKFDRVDITMGCNHFIDNLIMKHGIDGLQILEHDYKYYHRLNPAIQFATVGNLDPTKPVLIAAPFPGYLNLHPEWGLLISECEEKNIPVHIDGSWMGSANNIYLDLSSTAIHSIGLSLSKGLGMHWNRVGLRWSVHADPTDSICIYNNFKMIPESLVRNGIIAMQEIDIDYLWDTYEAKYKDICHVLKLRPTKIIHAAHSVDRKFLYGMRDLIGNSV